MSFGTKNPDGDRGILFGTQKIWHSKCRGSREDASCTKKVALKIQQGRKRRRETGVADEERCGEFALIFFRTKRLEEFTILVERGWNAGTVLFCSSLAAVIKGHNAGATGACAQFHRSRDGLDWS